MKLRPDAGIEVALEQRHRVLDEAQKVFSERERAVQDQARALVDAQARVQMVFLQIDAAQRPAPGVALAVALLGDLERLLDWCEVQVLVQKEQLEELRVSAEESRGVMAVAHQNVRALELVLEARKAERAEKVHRAELRLADETAARVHSRKAEVSR
jgi:hypothetical protein